MASVPKLRITITAGTFEKEGKDGKRIPCKRGVVYGGGEKALDGETIEIPEPEAVFLIGRGKAKVAKSAPSSK